MKMSDLTFSEAFFNFVNHMQSIDQCTRQKECPPAAALSLLQSAFNFPCFVMNCFYMTFLHTKYFSCIIRTLLLNCFLQSDIL